MNKYKYNLYRQVKLNAIGPRLELRCAHVLSYNGITKFFLQVKMPKVSTLLAPPADIHTLICVFVCYVDGYIHVIGVLVFHKYPLSLLSLFI